MSRLLGFIALIFLLIGCQVKEQQDSGELIAGNTPVTNAFTVTRPANGSYKLGTDLTFTLTHPFNVTVTGSPRLVLTVGASTVYADYVSGSGGKSLIFTYTVQAAMNDTDGISVATTLDLNGGTIFFNTTTAVSTTLSIASTASILVDTTIPIVTGTTFGTEGIYTLGQNVNITVAFDENVVVTGSPQVQFDLGGVTKNATYSFGSGTSSLIFSYNVVSGNKDLNGLDLLSASLNSATIADAAGNAATFSVTPEAMTDIYVHDVPTLITPVTASANDTYVVGETIALTATFSRATVVTGTPQIALDIGGVTKYADYQSGSGTTSLVFEYDVIAGDVDTNGIEVTGLVSLNGGTLTDSNGDPVLARTFTAPNTASINVDGVVPSISSITPPSNATYLIGQPMNFSVIFSEVVTITGTPTLDFVAGVTTKNSTYISGSGTTTLVFRYTPISGDLDANGIAMSAMNLTSGTIKDSNGNDIDVTLPSVTTTGVLISGITPTIISVTAPADATYLLGNNMDFTVVFSTAVTVTGSPRLTFASTDGTKNAAYLSGSGTTTLIFRYTVVSNDYDYNGIVVNSPLELNSGTIKDSNTYDSALTFTPPDTTSVLVDASPALISSITIPSSRTYGDGENLNFTVVFTKLVNITGTPRITINMGGSTVYANYLSGTGTSSIVFRKTVSSPDVDPNGIAISSPVGLNSGTIIDSNSINATLTYSVPDTSGVIVDSQGPAITLVTGPSNATYITGQNLNFTVDYSEIVNVSGGTPRLTLNIGGTTRYANYHSGSGSSSLVFRHTVLSNDLDDNGIGMTATVDVNGATIQDISTNSATNSFSAPTLTSVLVDAILPTITSVTAPANTVYANPSTVNFTVNYSKNITVTGTPRIHLNILGVTKYATYLSGTGTTAIVFSYSPATTDFDMNGTATQNSNDIDLNSGTMKDVLNNNAAVALGSIDLTKVYISYPGLGAWFDVDDATQITTVFSSPNYQTSDFNDKSGNTRNATQATAADRPYYLSSGFGSQNKPYIQNNTTDFMDLASDVANVKNVIMIFKTPATITTAPIFATTAGMIMGTTLSGTGALSFNSDAQWKINGGTLSGTAATSSTASTLAANTCYIASGVYTTAQTQTVQRIGSTAFLGQYAEVMVYTSASTFTDTELTVIHNYLNTKYGCY